MVLAEKETYVTKRNRIESPEIDPYTSLTVQSINFNKGGKKT